MPKIPRDISGRELAQLLDKYEYEIKRETGSHMRLVSEIRGKEHKLQYLIIPLLKSELLIIS